MPKIAYRRSRTDKFVNVADASDVTYNEDDWSVVHSLGEGPEIMHYRAHVAVQHNWTYDARHLPPDAEAKLAELEEAVRVAQLAKREWLAATFRQWAPVTKATAPEIRAGRSKADATAKLKATPKPSAERLAQGRRTVAALNRALG